MNILLINLTRFGDLLQSQAAITDLVRCGHKAAILCLENFAEAANLLTGISLVLPLPGAAFLAALRSEQHPRNKQGHNTRNWQTALADLGLLREKLEADFAPDLVCNLTPTLSARVLARFLAGGRPCLGFAMDEYGFNAHGNAWATFMQGASARGASPFNIVDIFRKITQKDTSRSTAETTAHIPPSSLPPGDAAIQAPAQDVQKAVREHLQIPAHADCKGYLGLQLGASEKRRRWPVSYFAELGERIWREEGLYPILLGSNSEKELAERYATYARHPFIDLCGKTTLAELASVLCACSLLVTNDTGTMHYAAGLDVPILAIFLATAQPFDTGPYRENSCSLEPNLPCHPCSFNTPCQHMLPLIATPGDSGNNQESSGEMCRFSITADHVAQLALSRLRQKKWQAPAAREALPVRIWLSAYDSEGFMTLHSLSGHGNETRILWLLLQKHYIRLYLDRNRESDFVPPDPPAPVSFTQQAQVALLADLDKAASLVELIGQQGRVLLTRPLPMMQKRFLSTWQKVRENFADSPYLKALSLLWMQETQMEGQNLPAVLEVTKHFQQLIAALSAAIRNEGRTPCSNSQAKMP